MNRNFSEWQFDVLKEYVFWHRLDDEAWSVFLERRSARKGFQSIPGPDLSTEAGRQEFTKIVQKLEQRGRESRAVGFEAMTLEKLRMYGLSHMDNMQVWSLYFNRLGISSAKPLPPDPGRSDIAEFVQAGFKAAPD